MKNANVIVGNQEIGGALTRYLNFISDIGDSTLNPFKSPYEITQVVEMAGKSDFLVVDGFVDGKPKGFQFAKAIEKKVLLLFYAGEIEVEDVGTFWVVLPFGLDSMGHKIHELLQKPAPELKEFEELEARFIELRERKRHHR